MNNKPTENRESGIELRDSSEHPSQQTNTNIAQNQVNISLEILFEFVRIM